MMVLVKRAAEQRQGFGVNFQKEMNICEESDKSRRREYALKGRFAAISALENISLSNIKITFIKYSRMGKKQSFIVKDNTLDLTCKQIGDKGVKNICSLNTNSIEMMCLYRNNITAVGIATLSSAKWNKLEILSLRLNNIGTIGCKYLTKIPIKNLKHIDLTRNHIRSAALLHISKAQWKFIEQIWFESDPLGIEGTKYLIRGNWMHFKQLYIYRCELSLPDILYLLFLPSNLTFMNVSENVTKNEEIDRLRRLVNSRIPNCDYYIHQ